MISSINFDFLIAFAFVIIWAFITPVDSHWIWLVLAALFASRQ